MKGKIKKEIPNIQKISLVNKPRSEKATGVTMEVIPKTAKMLKMFEPIRFPNEMAFSFFITAMMEADNSGILVPTETTVTAIIR